MKRTAACRCLILAVIFGVILTLPGGLLAAAGVQAPACPHCQAAGQGMGSCPCCQHHGQAHQERSSSQGGGFSCPCPAGAPACHTPTVTATFAWQVCSYVSAKVTTPTKTFPLTIFHPPQLQRLPLQI